MEFVYRLTGQGWAEAHVSLDGSATTVRASYLTDALGDLLSAVLALIDGVEQAACVWEQEPGECHWLLQRVGSDVRLRLVDVRDLHVPWIAIQGSLLLELELPLREASRAIAAGAQRVLDEYGEAGYLDLWAMHPFPTAPLERIRSGLT